MYWSRAGWPRPRYHHGKAEVRHHPWTFYGRSYPLISPERAVEDLRSIREPGVFIVDDVAFLQERHGMAIGEAIARSDIKKHYYLETRGDVLLRHKEVFRFWKSLGLEYMFLGIEA